jgi:hypothetical protein
VKTISTSIVLAEFGKFPFEHFAWGQALLYYNRVNMVIKDCILGKTCEAQLIMLAVGKKCWAISVKKWLFKNQPQEVAPLPSFPNIMLSVEWVKDNMRLAFIEKLLTNRAIKTSA